MKSSIGYHTFAIFLKLLLEEESDLHRYFFDYMKKNGPMGIRVLKNIGTIYTCKNNTGIRWLVINRAVGRSNFRITGVMAIITPEVLLNKDYITITTKSDIQEIKVAFNNEASKISPILGDFDSYSASRGDYCANFFLDELKIPCTSHQMMKLIKMGNIPTHYHERTEYDKATSHRKKTDPNSFYLESGSVVVNCYDKEAQLKNDEKHPCKNIKDAKNLIRFEIQCPNQKLHAMSKTPVFLATEPEPSIPTSSNEREMDAFYRDLITLLTHHRIALRIDTFLSDTICVEVINKYFRKIVRSGDYYTLAKAKNIIEMYRFHPKREKKLINALEMTNDHRGIYNTKLRLMGKDLLEYNRMLNDLDKLRINPVTIPRSWGIEYIPNLLNAYHDKVAEVQNDERRHEWECKLFKS